MTAAFAPAAETEPQDASRALLDRQIQALQELAELGLQLARAAARQAGGEGADAPGAATLSTLSLGYSRAARAVETAVALQSRLLDAHNARQAAVRVRVDAAAAERRDSVHRIARSQVWAAHGRDEDRVHRLDRIARRRLDSEELYGDILRRPISELVARICSDLGLSPDWPGLATELWAQEELRSGAPGEPLRGLASPPSADNGPSPTICETPLAWRERSG